MHKWFDKLRNTTFAAGVAAGVNTLPATASGLPPSASSTASPTPPTTIQWTGALGTEIPGDITVDIKWTAELVKQQLLISNQILDGLISSGQFVPLDMHVPEQKALSDQYNAIAAKLHISPPPTVYVDNSGIAGLGLGIVPAALSNITQEENPYIVVSRAFLTAWNPKQQIAVLAQELAQYKEKFLTPESIAEMLNNPTHALDAKFKADAVGTGADGTCHPEDLASALAVMYALEKKQYLMRNPYKTEADFEQYYALRNKTHRHNMLAHPPITDRIKALLTNNTGCSTATTTVAGITR